MTRIQLFLFLSAIICFSCKKSGDSSDKYDVYVAGHEEISGIHTVAKYWKNGESVALSDGSVDMMTTDVFVAGSDVYVAGYQMSGGIKGMYWKNGTTVNLSTSTNDIVTGIAVSGNDVFCVGYENFSSRAKFWKNGAASLLSTQSSTANAVFLSGNDVYICGTVYDNVARKRKPVYWKNGAITMLDYTLTNGSAGDIAVAGSDVYVTGNVTDDAGTDMAVVWKNGSMAILDKSPSVPKTYSRAITVVSGVVYCAGTEIKDGIGRARYWKNGSGVNVDEASNKDMGLTGIAVHGNDIFLSGYVTEASSSARAWKNGKEITLSNVGVRSSAANAIAVVRK